MVGGGQELIFPFLPLYLSATFFSVTICFVCLGWIKTETVESFACAAWWEPLRRVQTECLNEIFMVLFKQKLDLLK